MSRVVTASEVDRLHEQVATLQAQVAELTNFVDAVRGQLLLPSPAASQLEELFDANTFLDTEPGAAPAAAPDLQSSELFENNYFADPLAESTIAAEGPVEPQSQG